MLVSGRVPYMSVSYLCHTCVILYHSPDKDTVCPAQGEEKGKKESLAYTEDSTLVS